MDDVKLICRFIVIASREVEIFIKNASNPLIMLRVAEVEISVCMKEKEKEKNVSNTEVAEFVNDRFVGEMDWDNYGSVWVIDHLLPS